LAVPSSTLSLVTSADSMALAMPKSVTRTRPSSDSSTFAGLTSRWMSRASWAADRASATWPAMATASVISSRPLLSSRPRRVEPRTSSMTMASSPSSVQVS
jgi:hypothetical protein